MLVIPVLDLMDGRAVHARGGDRRAYQPVRSALLPSDAEPGGAEALVRAYRSELGHAQVYIADLNAIEGGPLQGKVLGGLIALGARVWVDAAAAGARRAREVDALGVERVIVGLETLASFEALREIREAIGRERVVLSIDVRGRAAVAAEAALRRMAPAAVAREAAAIGVGAVILLDLARVGRGGGGGGPDLEQVAAVRAAVPGTELLVGGGVRDRGDLERLEGAGVGGVLVASALHEGRLTARDLAGIARRE